MAKLMENRLLGRIYLAATAIFFAYYTLWVIVTPFVDSEYHDIWFAVFPPVSYALLPPAITSSVVFLLLLARTYYLVRQSRRKQRSS